MIILNLSNISLSYGTKKILNNISFNIQDSEHVSLVGVNGAGKSTLFKIITGDLHPDSGEVFMAKNKKIGYMEQNSGLESNATIWEEMLLTFKPLIDMEKRLKELEHRISIEKNASLLSSLMNEYSRLSDTFSSSGGFEYNSRAKGVLRGLGFDDGQFSLEIKTLSGGQKTRLALARLLLEEPDILLLDEPTNHLDINAIEWLEDFLKNYKKTLVVISHDRYFLDMVTKRTLEIENTECKSYDCNYSQYIERKKIDREIQQRHFDQQQKEIAKMEAFIEQQKRWNRERNIVAAESRQKAIDRMEKINAPKNLPGKIKMHFKPVLQSGNDVLSAVSLSKDFPGKPLFKDISFKAKRDEKVFILGPNGCGKSTLLKILAGRMEQTSGSFVFGHKVIMGYYDQEQEDMDESSTIIDEVWKANEKLTQTEIRNALAAFLFNGEDVLKEISVLSGGEKSRVALVKLMLSGANLLMLDEPTNHLDINSREVLEEALLNFQGTIIAVSHDRYFVNKLATRILEFNGDSLLDLAGNYSDFIAYKNSLKTDLGNSQSQEAFTESKLDYIAAREEKARLKKLEKQLSETEKEISQIEDRLSEIDGAMLSGNNSSDHVLLAQLHEEQTVLKEKLDGLYELWEDLSTLLAL